jgi:hypothetical protein
MSGTDKLRDRFLQRPVPSLDDAKRFLHRYWGDEGILDAVRKDLANTVAITPRSVIRGLQSIESLLQNPPPEGTLLDLVTWQANHPLDDPSEENAREWLRQMAELVRDVLGDLQPPRP